jgi:hypothetical protein
MNKIIKNIIKTKDKQNTISMLDWEKAFDSIDHRAIEEVLKHIQLPKKIINTINN